MQPKIPTNKIYYHWVDLLKSLSIFGVVYIHASLGLFDSLIFIPITNYFRFCVPVFITISFFLLERHLLNNKNESNSSIKNFLIRRLPRLIIPYIFWTCVYIIFNHKSSYPSITKFITNHWIGFGFSGQYYLVVLIVLTLVYPWLRKIKLSLSSLLIITFITILSYLPITYIPIVCTDRNCLGIPFLYIFYVFFGIFVARNYEKAQLLLCSINLYSKLILLFISPVLISFEEVLLGNWDSSGTKVYFRISTLLVTCLIVLVSISLENSLKSSRFIRQFISSPSQWSLGIFCLNPLLIQVFHDTSSITPAQELNYFLQIGLSFLFTLIFIFTSISISFLIERLGGKTLVK